MRALRSGWRGWAVLVCGLLLAMPVRAASKEPRWLRVASPEFVIITSLKEKEAAAWAAEFGQYVAALRTQFSASRWSMAPLTFIVFASERDFRDYRPLKPDGKPREVAGYFVHNYSWAVAGMGGSVQSDETRRIIFHEGVHWFLSVSEQPNPVWLEEGLAEVFSTFTTTADRAEWGRLIPEHVTRLRRHGLLPLDKLLFTGHEELSGMESTRAEMVYAQSWAFAHYLTFGKHGLPATAVSDYMRLSETKPAAEAFRQAFGKDFAELGRDLQRYLQDGSYFLRKRELAKFSPPKVEPATKVDVEEALGRLAYGAHHWALAATHARAAIASNPADPRGHQVLGLALLELGDKPAAVESFNRAVELGSSDARSYFELAAAEQNSGATGIGRGIVLSAEAARRAADRYEQAISLCPSLRMAYQNLSGVLDMAETSKPLDREVLEQGARLWPRDGMIQLGRAILTARAGDTAKAVEVARAVLTSTRSDDKDAREFARRLLDVWAQRDIIAKIEQFTHAEKYAEAGAFIDLCLERGVAASLQPQLVTTRKMMRGFAAMQRINGFLQAQDWQAARQAVQEVLKVDDAPAQVLTEATRILGDLDRQKLGLEEPGENKIVQALRAQRWAEARRLLEEVLASDTAPLQEKRAARKTLDNLDRRRLGLEAAKK